MFLIVPDAVVLKEGKLDVSSGKDTIQITGDQPEMIYVAIEPLLCSRPPPHPAALQSPTPTEPQTVDDRGMPPPTIIPCVEIHSSYFLRVRARQASLYSNGVFCS